MTPTQAQYSIAANAILKLLQQEIATQVPAWEQSFIPTAFEAPFAGAAAKAALDAVFATISDQGAST